MLEPGHPTLNWEFNHACAVRSETSNQILLLYNFLIHMLKKKVGFFKKKLVLLAPPPQWLCQLGQGHISWNMSSQIYTEACLLDACWCHNFILVLL